MIDSLLKITDSLQLPIYNHQLHQMAGWPHLYGGIITSLHFVVKTFCLNVYISLKNVTFERNLLRWMHFFSAHNSSTLREMCVAVENSPQIKFCRFLQRKTSKYRKYLALDGICSDGLKEENSVIPYHRISKIFFFKWVGGILI